MVQKQYALNNATNIVNCRAVNDLYKKQSYKISI